MKRIELTNGLFTEVDDLDFEMLNKLTWSFDDGYATTTKRIRTKTKRIKMHRLIMNCPDGMVVDHIDRVKLNNQRHNLRICTAADNARNTSVRSRSSSKYLGVYWEASKNRWAAQITINKKCKKLGRFKIEEDAAKAYDKAAILYFGEFANPNFKPETSKS